MSNLSFELFLLNLKNQNINYSSQGNSQFARLNLDTIRGSEYPSKFIISNSKITPVEFINFR